MANIVRADELIRISPKAGYAAADGLLEEGATLICLTCGHAGAPQGSRIQPCGCHCYDSPAHSWAMRTGAPQPAATSAGKGEGYDCGNHNRYLDCCLAAADIVGKAWARDGN